MRRKLGHVLPFNPTKRTLEFPALLPTQRHLVASGRDGAAATTPTAAAAAATAGAETEDEMTLRLVDPGEMLGIKSLFGRSFD
jgi:hypothetical protein